MLIVGHGSRHPEGNAEVERFAAEARARHPDRMILTCFIEFADLLLAEGLDRAAAAARRVATSHPPEVVVVPLIINAAGHVKMEIPAAIDAARARHPDVTFTLVPQIGTGDELMRALTGELRAAMRRLAMPDPTTTGVILLGRGSSDPGANAELAKVARLLYETTDHELVDLAFTGVTYPRLERVAQRLVTLGATQIVVLPVYLFTGVLIERIRAQVARLERQYPTVAWALGGILGFRPEITGWFDAIVTAPQEQLPTLACVGCKYRAWALDAGLGHHHDHGGHDHHHDHPGHGHPALHGHNPHDHHHDHAHHDHQAHSSTLDPALTDTPVTHLETQQ
jgi:sirohydrochlorin cobaltochelatase